MPDETYVVVKSVHGCGLAKLVEIRGDVAVIQRLKGQRYRLSRPVMFPPIEIPKSDVIREASRREFVLGHPV